MVKAKIISNFFSGLTSPMKSLNDSRFFAGLVMIMLNVGSKYVSIPLSPMQEKYLKKSLAKNILVFSIAWLGSRDVITAFILTIVFVTVTNYLLNEKSSLCVLPEKWKAIRDEIDFDGDGNITEDEIKRAVKILKDAKKQQGVKEGMDTRPSFKPPSKDALTLALEDDDSDINGLFRQLRQL